MSQARIQKAAKNISWGYLNRAINIVFPFIFRTVLIHFMGEGYTGINSLFSSVLRVLNISELGIGSALIYAMYEPIANNKKEKVEAYMNLFRKLYRIVGIVILLLGSALLPMIPRLISGTYPKEINIYLTYFLFLMNTAIGYLTFAHDGSLLEAMQRNDLENRNNAIVSLFRYFFEILSIILLKNFYGYLYVMLLFSFINNIVHHVTVRKYFPEFKCRGDITEREKEQLKDNVFSIFCHKIGSVLLNNTDSIVISTIFGLPLLVKYTNYLYIITSVEAIIVICFSSITSIIGNSLITDTEEENASIFKKVLFGNAWLVIVCSSIMLGCFQYFIRFWVGEQYLFSIDTVVLFVVYFFLHGIRRTIIMYRDASGRWRENRWQPLISGLFNLTVNIWLSKRIGINGVILSSIASMLLVDIPWESSTFFKDSLVFTLKDYIGKLFFYFLLSSFASWICLAISTKTGLSGLTGFVVLAIISFIISNAVVYIVYHKAEEYGYFLHVLDNIRANISKQLSDKVRH